MEDTSRGDGTIIGIKTTPVSALLYWGDCLGWYFDTRKRAHGHIPYRDRASQSFLRPPQEKEKTPSDIQDFPGVEPGSFENEEEGGVIGAEVEACDKEDAIPPMFYPTLE